MYIAIALALLRLVFGYTDTTSGYSCTSFVLPVTVTNVTTWIFPETLFPNGYAATAFANTITQRDFQNALPPLSSVTATYNISMQYCTPAMPSPKAKILQILSHGLGFDKRYWDFRLPHATSDQGYSYIRTALSYGYSTLSYDRLGCGDSSAPDPYTEVQSLVELEILISLTKSVKTGTLPHISAPDKILHIGHSWGSELTNALAATDPSLTDGIVLTGYSHVFQYELMFVSNSAFHLASENQPERFGDRSSGYLTWGDKYDNQYCYLQYPYFDPEVLDYAESTKYPFTGKSFLIFLYYASS